MNPANNNQDIMDDAEVANEIANMDLNGNNEQVQQRHEQINHGDRIAQQGGNNVEVQQQQHMEVNNDQNQVLPQPVGQDGVQPGQLPQEVLPPQNQQVNLAAQHHQQQIGLLHQGEGAANFPPQRFDGQGNAAYAGPPHHRPHPQLQQGAGAVALQAVYAGPPHYRQQPLIQQDEGAIGLLALQQGNMPFQRFEGQAHHPQQPIDLRPQQQQGQGAVGVQPLQRNNVLQQFERQDYALQYAGPARHPQQLIGPQPQLHQGQAPVGLQDLHANVPHQQFEGQHDALQYAGPPRHPQQLIGAQPQLHQGQAAVGLQDWRANVPPHGGPHRQPLQELGQQPAPAAGSLALHQHGRQANNLVQENKVGNKQRGKRGGNPTKREYFQKKFNPYHRGLENMAIYFAKQVSAMNNETAKINQEKKEAHEEDKSAVKDDDDIK